MKIIVTGCTRGIGLAVVKALVASGKHTIIGIARDRSRLEKLRSALGSNRFFPVVADLSDLAACEKIILSEIKSITPTVDILINNAGTLDCRPFTRFTAEQAQAQFGVNFFAPAALIRMLLPMLGQKGRAHVVNISSMGAVQGSKKFPGLSYYSAGKAALAVLTECLAEELREKNISFNCLALGAVQTDMLKKAFPGYKAQMTPSRMGRYIADFALNGADLFNGKIIPVTTSVP